MRKISTPDNELEQGGRWKRVFCGLVLGWFYFIYFWAFKATTACRVVLGKHFAPNFGHFSVPFSEQIIIRRIRRRSEVELLPSGFPRIAASCLFGEKRLWRWNNSVILVEIFCFERPRLKCTFVYTEILRSKKNQITLIVENNLSTIVAYLFAFTIRKLELWIQ